MKQTRVLVLTGKELAGETIIDLRTAVESIINNSPDPRNAVPNTPLRQFTVILEYGTGAAG